MDGGETIDSYGFLAHCGAIGRLIAAFDWSATSMGEIARWPPAVKSTIAMALRSPLPIATLWGEQGVMIYNDAYAVVAGKRHPDLLGANVREGWPEASDFNDAVMRSVFGRGETMSFRDEHFLLKREGRPDDSWLNLDYSPVLDEDGVPLGVIAIVIETTEKVMADRQLQAERDRLAQVYEQSPSFMALLEGPDHRFVLANRAFQQLVGHRDIAGKTVAEALPDTVRQGFLDRLDTVFSTGERYSAAGTKFEWQSTPGGEITDRYVDFIYQPLVDEGGRTTGIFVEGIDVTERVLAEEAIAASEAQFRTFAQSVPNHVWTAPDSGLLDWFNDRVLEYSGMSLDALEGVGWTRLVHPDDLPGAVAAWEKSLAAGDIYETEFRIQRHDGAYRWHLIRAIPILTEEEQIGRWVGTNTDIHEQKMSAAQSNRDRDRMWMLSQDLMLVCDFDGLIRSVNPSATRMLGWEASEMVGRHVADFLHPEDVDTTADEIAKLAQGKPTLAFENRYRTKDGGYRLLDWTGVPDSGRIHAVGRDITEERQLARDRERIWTLSPIVKVVAAIDGTIAAVNPTWTKVLGWSSTESIGRNILEFVDPDGREGAVKRLEALGKIDARVVESQSTFIGKDGEGHRFAWTTVPEGGMLYLFGRDITAETAAAETLAATEEALRQAQKMEAVGQLTGGIAHDFNNLLQGISGSLEIIKSRIAQGRVGDIDRFLTGAVGAANRAASLTHRLLAFSRRQPLDPRPVRANPLVSSMEDLLRRTIGERIELELVLSAGLWLTMCDPHQLENAILNLAINARDAMPDGGKLIIETANAHIDDSYAALQSGLKPGQYICLSVSDTGTGMSPDTIAKAFEPFFTTKPIGRGTGLGLSMIYGFAHQSEGYAKIYSELGLGTTFKLYLPRYRGEEDAEEAAPATTGTRPSEYGEVALVVEDEPVVRGLIIEVLTELGYRAIEAPDGLKAVEILQSSQQIDLLITDIGLPGLNGRQVADAGRAVRPDLRVLFMTGYAENAALASGFLEPGMEMITKPFSMEALATRLSAILDG